MKKEEIFDLKYTLSDYIFPRIKALKDLVDNNESPSLPDFENEVFFLDKEITTDLRIKFWSEKLEEMLFPFEYYSFPENFDNLEREVVKENVKKGLETFAKYFDDLWI